MMRQVVAWMTLVAACLGGGAAWAQEAATVPASPSSPALTAPVPQPVGPATAEDAELAAAAIRNMREEKWREAARAYQDSLGPDAPRGGAGLCCHPTPYRTLWCH